MFSSRWYFMDTRGTIPTGAMARALDWKFQACLVTELSCRCPVTPLYRETGCGAEDGLYATPGVNLGLGMAISILVTFRGGAYDRRLR